MKIRAIKTRLQARRAAFFKPVFELTIEPDGYKYKHIEPLPPSEHEYPIGRNAKTTAEILATDIEVIPDPDARPALKLVTVARKKDDHVVAHVSPEKAEEMIAKAKQQKKAALYVKAA